MKEMFASPELEMQCKDEICKCLKEHGVQVEAGGPLIDALIAKLGPFALQMLIALLSKLLVPTPPVPDPIAQP